MARRIPGQQRAGAEPKPNGATTGHEAELWAMADALRGSMDAAEYKHVVLGLIFLKYISDAFEERRATVLGEWGEDAAEDRDEYTAENIFWVPPEARWAHLKAQARQSTVGLTVDTAMAAIERDNPALEDVLPRDFARLSLDKQRLGQLIDLVSNIQVGDADARSRDVLGRVYEYNDTGDGLPFFQGRSDFGFRYPKNRKFCTAPNRMAQPRGHDRQRSRARGGHQHGVGTVLYRAWGRCASTSIRRGVLWLLRDSGVANAHA